MLRINISGLDGATELTSRLQPTFCRGVSALSATCGAAHGLMQARKNWGKQHGQLGGWEGGEEWASQCIMISGLNGATKQETKIPAILKSVACHC